MAAVPSVGGTIGRYKIVEQIGQGGMGVVFRAFDTQLQRHVALKFTAPTSDEARKKRFHTEALALARLNHPHIGVIHGFENIEGTDVLVMEHVAGKTLADHIGGKPLPQPEVIQLGLQLSAALREAHGSGVIHRDLKPTNIMITKDGDAKVLDFGLALLRVENSPTVSAVKLEGTIQYLSPEVLKGGIPDERSDIYSLGAVMYEMATGCPPHAKESFAQTLESILYQQPLPPEKVVHGISPALSGIIRKALATDVKDRYQTAAEFREDLLRLQSGTAIEIPPMFWPRRRRLRLAIALLLPVVAVLLLWLGSRVRGGFSGPEKKVIVVLPFEPIGGPPENRALSRGLADLLTIRLAQVSRRYGFEVVPASEVRTQEITSADQAYRKLGASLVVEGSWDFSSQRRIMYALVDPASKRNVDATIVPADVADISTAENNVFQQLLGMLNVELKDQPATAKAAPTNPDAYQFYVRGRGYLWDYQDQQNLTHAITLFQNAVKADPKFALAYAGLGEAYWRRYEETKDAQWVAEARSACEHANQLDSGLSEVHSTLGMIYHGTGKDQDAVESFEEALRLDPTNNSAILGLALSYQSLGNNHKAEQMYREAISMRPDYWGGYLELGKFFAQRGDLTQAAEQFRRITQLVPDNVRGYADLGAIYHLQGKYDEARKLYQQSLKVQPNYRAYSNLGTLDFYQKNYREAARNFELALGINDKDGRVWRNLGASYYWSGDHAKAREAYLKSASLMEGQLKVNPKNDKLRALLADSYVMADERQKAESLLAVALASQSSDPEIPFRAAGVYEHLGERAKALEQLKIAVAKGYSIQEIETDPTFADLRKDSRYTALQLQK